LKNQLSSSSDFSRLLKNSIKQDYASKKTMRIAVQGKRDKKEIKA
jgi:hypothetical protein